MDKNYLSINIHYSIDRKEELEIMIECMKAMPLYDNCEKVLLVDGKTNINPDGFKIIEVERPNKWYSRPKMWEEGVNASTCDNILYLDSDRILPLDFFKRVVERLEDGYFIFPLNHLYFTQKVNSTIANAVREKPSDFVHMLEDDSRTLETNCVNCKNPMSGCVAFTKKTFETSGGLDWQFMGWRMADADYYATCKKFFKFIPLEDCCDFHLRHEYGQPKEVMDLFYLWNGFKFMRKWKIKHQIFYDLASAYGIKMFDIDSVENKLNEIYKEPVLKNVIKFI